MPGGDKLITFQGEQGNLVRPLWPFKPRGECGKMVSDLLPRLAELADDMCFIHSMTAKTNTHGPGGQMSTGFTLDGFPSVGAWVSYALGTENRDLPAFVAIPDPRGVPQVGPANWGSGFFAGGLPGDGLHGGQADQLQAARRPVAQGRRRHARLPEPPQRRAPQGSPRRHRTVRPHRRLRAGGGCNSVERRSATSSRDDDARTLRLDDGRTSSPPPSRATASSPAGCWSGASASSHCSTGSYAMGEGVVNWDGHALRTSTTSTARSSISRRPRS